MDNVLSNNTPMFLTDSDGKIMSLPTWIELMHVWRDLEKRGLMFLQVSKLAEKKIKYFGGCGPHDQIYPLQKVGVASPVTAWVWSCCSGTSLEDYQDIHLILNQLLRTIL